MGDIYKKNCKHCGKAFKTDRKKVVICTECKKANKRKLDNERNSAYKSPKLEIKRKAKTYISLFAMVKIIEAYNQKHGTHYTYGKFVSALEQGKINI